MGVALVASVEATVERFVACVDVGVLLPIGTVGETSIAAFELTSKRFLTCQQKRRGDCQFLKSRKTISLWDSVTKFVIARLRHP